MKNKKTHILNFKKLCLCVSKWVSHTILCHHPILSLDVRIDKPEAKAQSKAQSPKKPQKGKREKRLVTKILWATTTTTPNF